MKLTGFELRNFRSIGSEPVILMPLRKCNVLVGQNNVGKSNVLRAVKRISDALGNRKPEGLTELDLHKRHPETSFLFKLYFESDISQEDIARQSGLTSFDFDFSWGKGNSPTLDDYTLARIEDFKKANILLQAFSNNYWTDWVDAATIRREFLRIRDGFFSRFSSAIPPVHTIPEFRQIRPGNDYTLDGANLIELLARYQHPEDGKDQDREKFDRIQRFVRDLLHLPEALLEVTHNRDMIMLTNEKLRLPLSSYGTGVHELVILVTAVLSIDNAICCIEEPEIHLHPRLQREFIDFITKETTNQYLISTHSPTFINAMNSNDNIQVFHLHLDEGATVGGPISRDSESLSALRDLGVQASDLLQSNCVIWVEGPSDRIYLKKWLELLAPDLVEGRHYSIMFYGGRLLSHLCADRENVPDELVHVLKINQNAIVVMDSDRKQADDDINTTKGRVKEECERSGGICWITDGREIENYLSERVVAVACEEFAGKSIALAVKLYVKFEQTLSKALDSAGATNVDYSEDKVKYARKFAQYYELADMGDSLREHIGEIVEKIKYWNE